MIYIIATFDDHVYVSTDINMEDSIIQIYSGWQSSLKERFEPKEKVVNKVIKTEDVFYLFQCFDDSFENTFGGVSAYETMPKKLVTISKKLACVYLIQKALKMASRPLPLRYIKRRFPFTKIFHNTTYYTAIDDYGFLFGIRVNPDGVYRKYYLEGSKC